MPDITRFYDAHRNDYQIALEEIRRGRKESCWMWYIFPQIAGLGRSRMSQYYAIADLEEAKAYLQDEMLGAHLTEISEALLALETKDAYAVFGAPDDWKLRSSMTLFAAADPGREVFQKVLDKFFGGKRDGQTLRLLAGEE